MLTRRQLWRRVQHVAAALNDTGAIVRTVETALAAGIPDRNPDLAACLQLTVSSSIQRQVNELEAIARHLKYADED